MSHHNPELRGALVYTLFFVPVMLAFALKVYAFSAVFMHNHMAKNVIMGPNFLGNDRLISKKGDKIFLFTGILDAISLASRTPV